jgi:hypothetical protein
MFKRELIDKYTVLGFGVAKYIQVALLFLSLFFFAILCLIGGPLTLWLCTIIPLVIINLVYYTLSDIKFNSEKFIIEKMFFKKEIASTEFIKVKRLTFPFNVFSIKFENHRFFFFSDFRSIFKSSNDLTKAIKNQLTSISSAT